MTSENAHESTLSFYEKIPSFSRFADLMVNSNYRAVPDDWIIVLTDIRGSTKAIQENRYKDVNLLGAASITAILNRLKGAKIPFVFGGDGASILIHSTHRSKILPALEATRRLGKESFDLELRIGLVPVKDIHQRGGEIEVAKFAPSPTSSFAMIRGGGLALAEKLLKAEPSSSNPYLLAARPELGPEILNSAFEGLSCRWNPVRSKRGEMVSLLVMALGPEPNEIYERVNSKIDSILSMDSAPISFEKIDKRYNPQNMFKEVLIHEVGRSFLLKALRFLRANFEALLMGILLKLKARLGTFSAEGYLREVAENTDTRKFDDVLRMVRDCSASERSAIEEYLEVERKEGRVVYGMHSSNTAMLTCLVFQLDNHFHFIDGGDGGYALAAKQLKDQLKLQP